jgi:phage terminase small subunit
LLSVDYAHCPYHRVAALSKLNIRAALEKKFADRSERTKVTADAVVQQLARIGFGNIAMMFDPRGGLRHLHDVPEDVQAMIGAIEVVTKKRVAKGRVVDVEYVYKIRTRDAVRALEQLGRHLGLFEKDNTANDEAHWVPALIMPPGTKVAVD